MPLAYKVFLNTLIFLLFSFLFVAKKLSITGTGYMTDGRKAISGDFLRPSRLRESQSISRDTKR